VLVTIASPCKTPDISNLTKEEFILLTVLEVSIPYGKEGIVELFNFSQKQRQEGARARYAFQRHAPSDLLPPNRFHLPQFPQPPNGLFIF
jgi:hypothetical protein